MIITGSPSRENQSGREMCCDVLSGASVEQTKRKVVPVIALRFLHTFTQMFAALRPNILSRAAAVQVML
jgi:hypothetical protein